jgi:SAM-dependent methyltransferase
MIRFDHLQAVDFSPAVRFLQRALALPQVIDFKRRSHALLSVGPGCRVLDAGCGTGDDAAAIACLVAPGGKVVGLDASADIVNEARCRHAKATHAPEFFRGDVMALPFDDGHFDATRADRLLHFLREPAAALREMIRVTRPGGHVVIGEPDWDSLLVHGGDEESTTRVLAAAVSGSQASPTIGRRLPALFAQGGLAVKAVDTAVLELDSVEESRYFFRLDALAVRSLGPSMAQRWLASLAQAAAEGRLRCSLTSYTVAGQRVGSVA